MLDNATNAKVTAFTVSMVGVEGGVVLKLPPPPPPSRLGLNSKSHSNIIYMRFHSVFGVDR